MLTNSSSTNGQPQLLAESPLLTKGFVRIVARPSLLPRVAVHPALVCGVKMRRDVTSGFSSQKINDPKKLIAPTITTWSSSVESRPYLQSLSALWRISTTHYKVPQVLCKLASKLRSKTYFGLLTATPLLLWAITAENTWEIKLTETK